MSTEVDSDATETLLESSCLSKQAGVTLVFEALQLFSDTLSRIHIDRLQLAASLRWIVESRDPIVCTGVGKSGFIGAKMAASLNSLGIRAVYLNPTDALHGDLGIVASGSVVLLISNSGNTSELLRLIPALRARSCRMIAVVGDSESRLAKSCNVVLAYGATTEVDEHGLAPTTSTVVQLAIADALASAASRLKGYRETDFHSNHPAGSLGKRLMKVEDLMRYGNRLPIVDESSKITDALIAMTSKGIGCVCIIDSKGRLEGLLTDGDIRRAIVQRIDLYSSFVGNLMQRSPQVALIGDRVENLLHQDGFLGRHFTIPVLDPDRHLKGVLVSIDLI